MRRPPVLVLLLFAGAAVLWWVSLAGLSSPAAASRPLTKPPKVELLPVDSGSPAVAVAMPAAKAATAGAGGSYWLPDATTRVQSSASTASSTVGSCSPHPGSAKAQRKLDRISASASRCAADGSSTAIACAVASATPEVLLIAAGASTRSEALKERLTAALAAVAAHPRQQALLIAGDADVATLAQSVGLGWWRPPGGAPVDAAHWHAASLLVRSGCTVVVSSGLVHWHASPFAHATTDVDVQVIASDCL